MNDRERAFYRVWSNVHRPPQGCWTWRGHSMGVKGGYHVVHVGYHPETGHSVNQVASRLVFETMYGSPLPDGMEAGHLCAQADCLKPSHLAGMTRAQNEAMKRRDPGDRRRRAS